MVAAIKAALEGAGLNSTEIQFRSAVSRYINNGGSYQRAAEIIQELSGECRIHDAKFGRTTCANARQPIASDGAIGFVRKTPIKVLPLTREPSKTSLDAVSRIKSIVAQTVLDRTKTSDGRAWGDVGAHELDGMERDGKLAKLIQSRIGVLTNADRFRKVRELITPKRFEECLSIAKGAADV